MVGIAENEQGVEVEVVEAEVAEEEEAGKMVDHLHLVEVDSYYFNDRVLSDLHLQMGISIDQARLHLYLPRIRNLMPRMRVMPVLAIQSDPTARSRDQAQIFNLTNPDLLLLLSNLASFNVCQVLQVPLHLRRCALLPRALSLSTQIPTACPSDPLDHPTWIIISWGQDLTIEVLSILGR